MKIERKYMAHYLNATFAADDGTASYVRLGKDLEEYSPELSANVEKKTNILGNETVSIDSYQKQGEVSPYYAEKGDPLFEKLQNLRQIYLQFTRRFLLMALLLLRLVLRYFQRQVMLL